MICCPAYFRSQTVYQVIEESLLAEAVYGTCDQRLCHNFQLFMAPPVRVFPRDATSLKESNTQAPACVLHLRWESENVQVKRWAERLEESMSQAMGGSVHPRVPYSSRFARSLCLSRSRHLAIRLLRLWSTKFTDVPTNLDCASDNFCRYDVPEAISSKRPQGPQDVREGAHTAGLESGSESGSSGSPTL